MSTIEHFEIVEFPGFTRGFVLVCSICRFAPGLGKWTLREHTHGKSWKCMKASIEAKKKEIGGIIKPEVLESSVLPKLHGVCEYRFLKTVVGFACSDCDNKTMTETIARKHKREEHGDQGDIQRVEMQSFYQGRKSQYFIVGGTVHGTDDISCGKAPNSPIKGQTPTQLATDAGRKTGLGKIDLINGTTSLSAIESPPRTASPGRRQGIAQENGDRASSTDTTLNFEQPTDRMRLPFNGFWDQESGVPTYQPSKVEFSDFVNFMRNITRSEEFTGIGVAMVKVPPGSLSISRTTAFASRAKGRISYYMQTSAVTEGTSNQVFKIDHEEWTNRLESDWKTKEKQAITSNGEKVGMQEIAKFLESGSFRAPYMCNLPAESILSRLSVPLSGLSQLPGNALSSAGIPGMSTDYIYVGSPGSLTAMHIEDHNIPSLNFNLKGESKQWVSIIPSHKAKFEKEVKELPGGKNSDCSQFVRHRNLFVSPQFLVRKKIDYRFFSQEEGVMVVVHGEAYHQVLNTGSNIATANNFALPWRTYWDGYTQCSREACGKDAGWYLIHDENGQILKKDFNAHDERDGGGERVAGRGRKRKQPPAREGEQATRRLRERLSGSKTQAG